ncbi:TPA: hypothetical protein DDZ01_03515 [Candidatus Uhrbacteria bacterium]|nr:MAG: hypothetical protein UT94_C0002G0039 [Candidatus Uhrbacteria bacterium GW2011_GWF2_40_263]OGL97377.1 MAG: hypothetical protein A2332_04630 [Candidatus Uhrbacteria bacterium RIFOXYB2_FULL_41_18]HBK35035.1 hypothetical protein [Candidatus Uhrbacteria bacterium]HCB56188.1 hypothetical protein [Candidatus Uhrbacteria bacterium]
MIFFFCLFVLSLQHRTYLGYSASRNQQKHPPVVSAFVGDPSETSLEPICGGDAGVGDVSGACYGWDVTDREGLD